MALAAAFGRMKMFERGEDYGEMNHASRGAIAEMAWEVEIDRLRRPIGRQDHMAAAYGGLRLYRFERDQDEVERAEVEREFSEEDARWLATHLVLVQLPGGHDAREILSGVKSVEQLAVAAEAVDEGVRAIEERNVARLGQALQMGQASKGKIAGAVPRAVVEVIDRVRPLLGVRGVKVCGAGGGGHLLVAHEDDVTQVQIAQAAELEVAVVEPDFGGVRSDGWR